MTRIMVKNKVKGRQGFTLIELMIASVLAIFILFAVAVVIADSQRGWNTMYNRIHSEAASDGYVARKTFDQVVRNASQRTILLDSNGAWVEVYYYSDANSIDPDLYAHFYTSNSALYLERGIKTPKETLTTQTICRNVDSCVFKTAGNSVQMMLTLDDGEQRIKVITSAYMHNE